MKKKGLLVLILAIIVAGGIFAQEEDVAFGGINQNGSDFDLLPKNTIVLDIGPTIIGVGYGVAINDLFAEEDDISGSGFGFAIQYERQLTPKLSVAGRFAYMGLGLDMTFSESLVTIKTSSDISTISIDAYARYYPWEKNFFIGGFLGYGNMSYSASATDNKSKESISITTHYFKLGPRLGWRIDFGNPGGFVMDTSFGWDIAIRMGASTGSQFNKLFNGFEDFNGEDEGEVFDFIESLFFVGGPRLTISFGWRF